MSKTMAPEPATEHALSAECAVAAQPGYEDLHAECRQIADVPLPHSNGIILVARCRCTCHRGGAA